MGDLCNKLSSLEIVDLHLLVGGYAEKILLVGRQCSSGYALQVKRLSILVYFVNKELTVFETALF